MRILLNELRRIFNPWLLLILAVFTAAFFELFVMSYMSIFPNGNEQVDCRIMEEMRKDYGPTMDQKEFADFQNRYNKEVKQAEDYFRRYPTYKNAGITTYKQFRKLNFGTPTTEKLWDQAYAAFGGWKNPKALFIDLQERDSIMNFYKNSLKKNYMEEYDPNYKQTAAQKARINQIKEENGFQGIFPGVWVFDNDYNPTYNYEFALVIFSVLFLLGPVYLHDRRRKVRCLQYSSAAGRGLFKTKALAVAIATFLLITVQLALFFIVFATSYSGRYFDASIITFYGGFVPWFNLTFLQYILITFANLYFIGLCTAMYVLLISRLSPNVVALTALLIPLAYAVINLVRRYSPDIYTGLKFVGVEYAALLLVAAILPIILWRREKRLDICN